MIQLSPTYSIYTDEYDEIVRPLDLVDQETLDKVAERFHVLCPVEDFEPLREKLAQIAVPDVPTGVIVLIDNSNSMMGASITFATGAAGIIGMYLDRLGVQNEILGFTTKSWKGGDSRIQWIHDGRPRNPGRLCDLRHVIYKTANEQLSDVRNNLALMMMNDQDGNGKFKLIKENVDGEAVLWACERLRALDVQKRVLLVISDGAPVDDSTLQINPEPIGEFDEFGRHDKSCLALHLREVISDINKAGDIKIDAIGIKHDVSKYYGTGTMINQLEDLAPVAIDKLISILQ